MTCKYTRVERFLDAAREPRKELTPLDGYEKAHMVTLEQSLQSIVEKIDKLETMMTIAKRNARKPVDGLTPDESAAIHLYTMQWPETHPSLYATLNSALRCQNRKGLVPWFPYLKLLLTALFKLPSFKGTIWRGVRGNLNEVLNEDVIWWGLSSCTEKLPLMEDFLGVDGERTLFNIQCINGKSIRAHSHFEEEEEMLLMPGTYLKVVGKWSPSKDLHIVHLQEAPPPYQTLVPPFVLPPPPTDFPPLESLEISKKPAKVSTDPTTSTKTAGKIL